MACKTACGSVKIVHSRCPRSARREPRGNLAAATYTMVRVSYGKIAIRRAVRDVHALTLLMCLEVAGVWPKQTLASHGLAGMSSVSFSLWVSCQRLQVLLQTRYLRMDRDFVPKSRNWSLYVLDALPEYQWRTFMRMDRATYAQLALLVAPHLPKQRRTGRPLFPVDLMQKVALFSLGHYGNAASTLYPAYLMIDLFASVRWLFLSDWLTLCFVYIYSFILFVSIFLVFFRCHRGRQRVWPERRDRREVHAPLHSRRQQALRYLHCVAFGGTTAVAGSVRMGDLWVPRLRGLNRRHPNPPRLRPPSPTLDLLGPA